MNDDPKQPSLFGPPPPARRPSAPAAKPAPVSAKKPLGPSKKRLDPVTGDLFDTRVWSKYQNAVFEAVETTDDNIAVLARAGAGKCLGLGTPVMMADGRVIPVEEVKAGDLLMGPDSEPRRVLGTNRGRGPLYRIVPVKGEPWVCNDVHVLTLAGSNHNMGKVIDIPLNEHLAASAAKGERPDRNWKLWRVGVNFPERPLPIEPYLLGLWLGDGTLAVPHITNADPEIHAYCREAAPRHKVELMMVAEEKNNTWRLSFRVPNGEGSRANPNPLWRVLQTCIRGGEKFIPDEFLRSGRQQRLELLAGLLDTDGSLSHGGYEIVFKPKGLAEQVVYLARSLGFAAYMVEREGVCQTSEGTFRGLYQRVFISGDVNMIPCKVSRKKASPRRQIKRVNVTGFEVESLGEGEYAGFELDRDGRFLLGDFTVTHNTTLIEEITKRLPGDKTVLVVAFNKSIAEELKTRVRGGCSVMTTNGLGHRAVTNAFGSKKPEADKWVRRMLREHYFPARSDASKRTAIADMVGRAKNSLLKEAHEIRPLIDKLKIDPCILLDDSEISLLGREAAEEDGRRRLVAMVQTVLGRCEKALPTTDIIDYDDQIWAPNQLNLAVGTWDIVLVDESQDLNVAQMELIARAMGPKSRIIVVGDPRQAIYGFRGADPNAFQKLVDRFTCRVLPLPVTYRCGRTIVAEARRLVPDFEAGPNNPEGEVLTADKLEVDDLEVGDFVISRKNAPLVELCFRAIAQGKPAMLAGRDLGRELRRQVEDAEEKAGGYGTAETVMKLVLADIDRQVKMLGDEEEDFGDLLDRRDCLLSLFRAKGTIEGVKEALDCLFDDGDKLKGKVVFCSAHRSKGLETNRVWLLSSTFQAERSYEEGNLLYVATTRAIQTLVYVAETF